MSSGEHVGHTTSGVINRKENNPCSNGKRYTKTSGTVRDKQTINIGSK